MELLEEVNEWKNITARQLDQYVKVRDRMDYVDQRLLSLSAGQSALAQRQEKIAHDVVFLRDGYVETQRDLRDLKDAHAELKSELDEFRTETKRDIKDVRSQMATKDDLREGLAEVRSEMQSGLAEVRSEMQSGLAEVRSEMQSGLAGVRSEMQSGLAGVRSEMQSGLAEVRSEMQAGFREIKDLVS